MVRVLLCHHFKAQRVFSESYQPTTIWTTKDYLFLATGTMKVCVYSLEQPTFPLLFQFPTMSKPVKLTCSDRAKYVATIERETQRSGRERNHQTYARVYFNWTKASAGEAVRAVFAGHSKKSTEGSAFTSQFVAVQLPLAFLPVGISSCPSTGNVLVAGAKRLCLFRLCGRDETNSNRNCTVCCDFELVVDIDPGLMCIRGIALGDSFIAVRSYVEVRIIKLVFSSPKDAVPPKGMFICGDVSGRTNNNRVLGSGLDSQHEVIDENCIHWNFEECVETNATTSQDCKPARHPHPTKDDIVFPSIRMEDVFKDTKSGPKEILGPTLHVLGHPMRVSLAGLCGIGIAVDGELLEVCGVTMLYRRFTAEKLGSEDTDSTSLHTLQLLPTYTRGLQTGQRIVKSPLYTMDMGDTVLCGMCCLVSGPKEGYMYDVLTQTKLLSCYQYTCDTISVSACHSLLHAITRQGLETYTVRIYSSASEWVREQLREQNVRHEQKHHQVKMKKNCETLESSLREHSDAVDLEECSPSTVVEALGPRLIETSHLTAAVTESPLGVVRTEKCSEEGSMIGKVGDACSVSEDTGTTTTETVVCSTAYDLETGPGSDAYSGKVLQDSASLLEQGKEERRTQHVVIPHSGAREIPDTSPEHRQSACDVATATKPEVGNTREVGNVNYLRDIRDQMPHRSYTPPDAATKKPNPGLECDQNSSTVTEAKLSGREEFPLPVYDVEWLRQLCPSASLDICLIGMYPFIGPLFVSATEESVALFTRASHDASQRGNSFRSQSASPQKPSDSPPEWSVYLLLNMDPIQMYKAVMPLANRCQKHNAEAYHHLVCEQHLFLRTLCLVEQDAKEDNKNVKKLKKLLCESAANLADLYARSSEDVESSAEYYNMSGCPLRDVVDRTWKLSHLVGDGVVQFLDAKLFGSDEPVIVTEATAKKIFKIYSKVKPSRVSELVLMSSLNGFSPETALGALEDIKKTAAAGDPTSYSLSALDNLVCAVLYIHQCDPEQAESALSAVSKEELLEVLTTHSYLLHEDQKHFTPLAQLLRKHHSKVFLDVLLYLHNNRQMSLDTILHLLGAEKPSAYQSDHVLEFLEPVLNDLQRLKSFGCAVIHLSNIYLQRILDPKQLPRNVSPSTHFHIPKGDGHFATRLLWLDKLPPFKGSVPGPKDCCLSLGFPQTGSASSLVSIRSRRAGRTSSPVPSRSCRESEKCCCCCKQELLKLQSLLSSDFASAELCGFILDTLEGHPFPGHCAVRLLCLPHVDKVKEATNLAVQEFPFILLPYAKHFFGADVKKWSYLLDILLQKFREDKSDDQDSETARKILLSILKGLLSHLAEITSPTELLTLLPSDGTLAFFLPFLEQCYSHTASQRVTQHLASGTKQTLSDIFS